MSFDQPSISPELSVQTPANFLRLSDAKRLQVLRIVRVDGCARMADDTAKRLDELGFLPGEQVSVLATGVPGQDPMAVRVGNSTFALRRAEAECVMVVVVVMAEPFAASAQAQPK